jgi:hypothetical protein
MTGFPCVEPNSAPVVLQCGRGLSFPRPLVQHARPLPYGHADTRPVLGPPIKDALGFVQTAAGKQQLGYTLTIARPLLAWATALRPVSLRRGLSRVERDQQAPRSPMPGSRFEVPQDSPREMVFLLMRPSEAHEEQVDSAVSASQHGLEVIAGARAFNCFLSATGSAGKFCRHRQDHKVSQRSGC